MSTSDRPIIWAVLYFSLVGGCAAPALTESAAINGTHAQVADLVSQDRVDGAESRKAAVPSRGVISEAALVRAAALEQGFSESEANDFQEMVRSAPPEARPYVTGIIYRSLYRGATKRAGASPEPIMLVGRDEPRTKATDAASAQSKKRSSEEQLATPSNDGNSTADASTSASPSPRHEPPASKHDSDPDSRSQWAAITSKRLRELRQSNPDAEDDPHGNASDQTPVASELPEHQGAAADSQPTGSGSVHVEELDDRDGESATKISWRRLLRQTILRMREELAGDSLDEHERAQHRARLSLLLLAAEDLEKAMASLEGFDDEQLEFWRQTVMGLGILLDPEELPKFRQRVDAATDHLRQGVTSLATLGPLRLENLAFCTQVDKFGDFVEIESYTLKPGEPILIYVELENFGIEEIGAAGADGKKQRRSSRRGLRSARNVPMYEAELRGRYEIYDRNQRTIVSRVLPVSRDSCRNRRRDFFTSYEIVMPEQIEPGSYTFDLTIEDKKANKLGNAVLDFRIR